MARYFGEIDTSKIFIGDVEFGNNGGRYKRISYDGQQIKDIQLGASVNDLLRCPFGIEPVAANAPDKFCFKVDANENLTKFIQDLDAQVIQSVNDETLTHRSTLRVGTLNNNLRIKILPDTQFLTTTKKSENVFTQPATGFKEDITPNSMLLPIIKIQNGVYYIEENYGTSIVATQVLIVKGHNTNEHVPFLFGNNITMEEAAE